MSDPIRETELDELESEAREYLRSHRHRPTKLVRAQYDHIRALRMRLAKAERNAELTRLDKSRYSEAKAVQDLINEMREGDTWDKESLIEWRNNLLFAYRDESPY